MISKQVIQSFNIKTGIVQAYPTYCTRAKVLAPIGIRIHESVRRTSGKLQATKQLRWFSPLQRQAPQQISKEPQPTWQERSNEMIAQKQQEFAQQQEEFENNEALALIYMAEPNLNEEDQYFDCEVIIDPQFFTAQFELITKQQNIMYNNFRDPLRSLPANLSLDDKITLLTRANSVIRTKVLKQLDLCSASTFLCQQLDEDEDLVTTANLQTLKEPIYVNIKFHPVVCKPIADVWQLPKLKIPVFNPEQVLASYLEAEYRKVYKRRDTPKKYRVKPCDEVYAEVDVLNDLGNRVNKESFRIEIDTFRSDYIGIVDYIYGCKKGDYVHLEKGFTFDGLDFDITTTEDPDEYHMGLKILDIQTVQKEYIDDLKVKMHFGFKSKEDLEESVRKEAQDSLTAQSSLAFHQVLMAFKNHISKCYHVKVSEAWLLGYYANKIINSINTEEECLQAIKFYDMGVTPSELVFQIQNRNFSTLLKGVTKRFGDVKAPALQDAIMTIAFDAFIEANKDLQPQQQEMQAHVEKAVEDVFRMQLEQCERENQPMTQKQQEVLYANLMEHIPASPEYEAWQKQLNLENIAQKGLIEENRQVLRTTWMRQVQKQIENGAQNLTYEKFILTEDDIRIRYLLKQ